MPTLLEILNKTTDFFAEKGIENSRLDAQLIIGDVLNLSRMDLYLNYDKPLSDNELNQCREYVKRRSNREPLQHILGKVHFRDLELKTDKRALIPRKETEIIVDIVKKKAEEISNENPLDILEIGVGTGAILFSLMTEKPDWNYKGVDVSSEALQLAQENAKSLGLAADQVLLNSDSFSQLDGEESWDIIVSNPPYIGDEEFDSLMPEVKNWDPELALRGGEKGYEFPMQLINESQDRLKPSGFLILEIGADQFSYYKNQIEKTNWSNLEVQNDYSGHNRFIILKK